MRGPAMNRTRKYRSGRAPAQSQALGGLGVESRMAFRGAGASLEVRTASLPGAAHASAQDLILRSWRGLPDTEKARLVSEALEAYDHFVFAPSHEDP